MKKDKELIKEKLDDINRKITMNKRVVVQRK